MLIFYDGIFPVMYYYDADMKLCCCFLGYETKVAGFESKIVSTLTQLRENLKYRTHPVEILEDTGDL